MKHKLIKDVNEDIWRKFVAFCKLKDVKVGKELNEILESHLKQSFNKLLRE